MVHSFVLSLYFLPMLGSWRLYEVLKVYHCGCRCCCGANRTLQRTTVRKEALTTLG